MPLSTPDLGWLVALVLVSIRLAPLVLVTPVLGTGTVPVTVRVLLVIALAAALSWHSPPAEARSALAALVSAPHALVRAAAVEAGLGATLALGVVVAFSTLTLAGEFLGVQVGLGLAQVLDVAARARVPLLASAYQQVGVLVFLLLDGHHAVLRGLALSLERFPLGGLWSPRAALGPVLGQVAGLFALGLALAAPVAVAILLLETALGIAARSLPQLNMLTVGIPVKVVAGLAALSLWFADGDPGLSRVYGGIYRGWEALFAAAQGVR